MLYAAPATSCGEAPNGQGYCQCLTCEAWRSKEATYCHAQRTSWWQCSGHRIERTPHGKPKAYVMQLHAPGVQVSCISWRSLLTAQHPWQRDKLHPQLAVCLGFGTLQLPCLGPPAPLPSWWRVQLPLYSFISHSSSTVITHASPSRLLLEPLMFSKSYTSSAIPVKACNISLADPSPESSKNTCTSCCHLHLVRLWWNSQVHSGVVSKADLSNTWWDYHRESLKCNAMIGKTSWRYVIWSMDICR